MAEPPPDASLAARWTGVTGPSFLRNDGSWRLLASHGREFLVLEPAEIANEVRVMA